MCRVRWTCQGLSLNFPPGFTEAGGRAGGGQVWFAACKAAWGQLGHTGLSHVGLCTRCICSLPGAGGSGWLVGWGMGAAE